MRNRLAPAGLIWATRGRTWGFRFLLDDGLDDPLVAYEQAFHDLTSEELTAVGRQGPVVALRFPDPLGRTDSAGRTIPHEFVVRGPLSDRIEFSDDGLALVWPLVAATYDEVWDDAAGPRAQDLWSSAR